MEKTKEADNNINLLMQLADVVFSPAGLNFTNNLTKQILKRNIPILQGVLNTVSKGSMPIAIFNHFMELCQKHEIENAVNFISEQLDVVTKIFVAFMSESRKNG
jgi:hypothetical protein